MKNKQQEAITEQQAADKIRTTTEAVEHYNKLRKDYGPREETWYSVHVTNLDAPPNEYCVDGTSHSSCVPALADVQSLVDDLGWPNTRVLVRRITSVLVPWCSGYDD